MCVCVCVCAGLVLGDAVPNGEQFQSAHVASQLTPRYVLDKPRVDYTLARGPLRRGALMGAIGPIGLRPVLCVYVCVCVCALTNMLM